MNDIEESIAENWRPIVEAAGFYHPSQDAATLFLLSGFIMKDPIVAARAAKKLTAHKWSEAEPVCKNAHVDVLLEMTPGEKKALQRRILQVTAAMQAKAPDPRSGN